ncbi:helix-turn-helix domain-containing protein [Mariniflexile gromovii]|uniref:Helix-turn-helix transcriptional regulator n=1 Tax=Mariniflexile gromovii TaxID=362523 RepID=A0ABS4BNR6_9FLAO|nr:AraC family transcriptional regulator [Mariniflexile gromovii]MBP0902244.1 helix-turn-helix transcriptional regulator [Mariniflexile gromovii]
MAHLAVKNMVCNRCIKVVKEELIKNNINFSHVDLGTIYFKEDILEVEKEKLKTILEKEGFELVEDKEAVIVENIKSIIVQIIHHGKEKPSFQNFSEFISSEINMDYSQLSKLFSEIKGNTIEHYIIEQRIERAKELIVYNELNLSQISYELNYSSPQHLSRQFKQITGLTPSEFKNIRTRKKLDTI